VSSVKKVNLDLFGLDSNAYSLMSVFRRQARKEKWSKEEITIVITECKGGDYDHLLQTLIAHCEQ